MNNDFLDILCPCKTCISPIWINFTCNLGGGGLVRRNKMTCNQQTKQRRKYKTSKQRNPSVAYPRLYNFGIQSNWTREAWWNHHSPSCDVEMKWVSRRTASISSSFFFIQIIQIANPIYTRSKNIKNNTNTLEEIRDLKNTSQLFFHHYGKIIKI